MLLTDLKFDHSNFKKEVEDEDLYESYLYLNEKSGVVFQIDGGEVRKVIFYPNESSKRLLCRNENTSEVFSNRKRLVDFVLENEPISCGVNTSANVTDVYLSATEVFSSCNNLNDINCLDGNAKIFVLTLAEDLENDVLVYDYKVSGGKILGAGDKISWDLSGVPAGKYTITAGVDDGTGVTGKTITKTVVVK